MEHESKIDARFHLFDVDVSEIAIPERFTYPFRYMPHRLSVIAVNQMMRYVERDEALREDLYKGKMMGVLVVENGGTVGFLSAFSGNLAHCNDCEYFVPAVFDLLDKNGFFVPEEKNISAINQLISEEENSEERRLLLEKIAEAEKCASTEIEDYRRFMSESKRKRDELRLNGVDDMALVAESQYQKAELKRKKMAWRECIDSLRRELQVREDRLRELRTERRERSVLLQRRVFDNFVMLNAKGHSRSITDIFASTPRLVPPAGTGECAAPKMLQYAYLHGYKPLAMAEVWVGESPKEEIRHHGHYYPSCKSKCQPVLEWMLDGLDVESNPLARRPNIDDLAVLYEDDWMIAIDKPHGVLSVPGKLAMPCVLDLIKRRAGGAYIPLIVHRLDMDTSGVLLFAKTHHVQKSMQAMFKDRRVCKTYVAILDGNVGRRNGRIVLPISVNPEDRPRQMVNYDCGKPAVTRYEVVESGNDTSRVLLYPETGRTHQLRVHSSHRDGLNVPILGDVLYGRGADRLYLHASEVSFTHPVTSMTISIKSAVPF